MTRTCPDATPFARTASPKANPAARRPVDDLNEAGKRIQELMDRAAASPSPGIRELVQECVQSLLGFQGKGLAHILNVLRASGTAGEKAIDALIHDAGVSGLLLIHGLHPLDQETRLHAALKKVRPHMESHGGNVELISLQDDVARLRFQGACNGCPSSAITMELAIRQAVEEACPDLCGLEVDGVSSQQPAPA